MLPSNLDACSKQRNRLFAKSQQEARIQTERASKRAVLQWRQVRNQERYRFRPIFEHRQNRLLDMPREVFRDFPATLRHGLSNAGQLLAYPLRNLAEVFASLTHRLRRRSSQRPRWWIAGVAAPTFALSSRTVEPTPGQGQK